LFSPCKLELFLPIDKLDARHQTSYKQVLSGFRYVFGTVPHQILNMYYVAGQPEIHGVEAVLFEIPGLSDMPFLFKVLSSDQQPSIVIFVGFLETHFGAKIDSDDPRFGATGPAYTPSGYTQARQT
jgi:hypothetical protein